MRTSIPVSSLYPLLGLSASAFLFNTSEFMPIGLLLDISQSFGMSPGHTDIMITLYAWFVGFLSLPLMLATCRMAPKRLLLFTMALFVIGQAGSGLAVNFPMLVAFRIVVACAHSIFWAIVGPLATQIVPRGHQPFALSMVATGTSIAMILGLPLGRLIGLALGWRMTFLFLSFVSLLDMAYLWRIFPVLTQGAPFTLHDLPGLLRNPIVMGVSFLALLYAGSHFTVYSYIEPFLETVAHFSAQGITWTLVFLGVCGIGGSAVFFRFYEARRQPVFYFELGALLAVMVLFLPAASFRPTMLLCCMVFGMIFTMFGTTMQAELIRGCPQAAAPVAMAIYSGIFNVGIASGTWLGGHLVSRDLLSYIGFAGAVLAVGATLVALCFYVPKIKAGSGQP